jgi:hypothetical protein
MGILVPQMNIKVILLCLLVLCYLAFRLLGFGIGPRKLTRWFWGETSDKKPKPIISNSK